MAQKDQSSLFDEHTTNENETKNLFADSEKIKEQIKRSRRKVFITVIVIALCAVGLCTGWRIYYNSQLEQQEKNYCRNSRRLQYR